MQIEFNYVDDDDMVKSPVSIHIKLMQECAQLSSLVDILYLCSKIFKTIIKSLRKITKKDTAGIECGRSRVQSPVKDRVIPKTL